MDVGAFVLRRMYYRGLGYAIKHTCCLFYNSMCSISLTKCQKEKKVVHNTLNHSLGLKAYHSFKLIDDGA